MIVATEEPEKLGGPWRCTAKDGIFSLTIRYMVAQIWLALDPEGKENFEER